MGSTISQFGWPVTPHIGLGLGGATLDGSFDAPSVGYRSKTSDVVFAYQAIAGVRYLVNPTLALDLDYRYRGTSGMNYTTNAVTVGGVTFPSRKISGNGNTHNFVASLSWLFPPRHRHRRRRRRPWRHPSASASSDLSRRTGLAAKFAGVAAAAPVSRAANTWRISTL